jgi:hypothetical protein
LGWRSDAGIWAEGRRSRIPEFFAPIPKKHFKGFRHLDITFHSIDDRF